MMAYLTLSEHVNRAPAEVFAYMMDFTQAPRWRRLVERMELVGSTAPAVGSAVHVTYRYGGEAHQRVFLITDYDPPRMMAWRMDVKTHDWVVRYQVEPEGDFSRVTLTLEARAHAWIDQLKSWLFRGTQRRELTGQLAALKRAMESGVVQESRS